MLSSFKALYQYRELIQNLVVRNLKVRYKNSSLGFLWTLLHPLLYIAIYYFFISLMRFEMDLAELLTGVIPWHFFSMTLGDSVDVISGNATLITKVRFPRIILPMATAIANVINYLLSLVVLLIFLPIIGVSWSLPLLLLPLIITLSFLFTFGVSLCICTANVYFKDTAHLLGSGLMAWFFMTPIIYPLSQIPERYHDLVYLNPMAALITLYRYAMLGREFDFSLIFLTSFVTIILVFVIGVKAFKKYEPLFADEL